MPFVAPKYALESSICSYLTTCSYSSGSLLSGSSYTCYTGIGNVDLASAPAVIVDGGIIREVVPFSRCYEFSTRIIVKESAFDTAPSQLGILAQNIFNECVNTQQASSNFASSTYNINVWQVITDSMEANHDGDFLVNEINLRVIGALV